MIIHGTDDKSIPIEQSQKLSKLIPNCKLIEYENAGHRLDYDGDFSRQRKDMIDFFTEDINKKKDGVEADVK